MYTKKFLQIFVTLILLAATAAPVQAETQVQPLYDDVDFGWAKSMGGTGRDFGWSIAVDSSGNVYTTGYFEGTVDFDPGPGIFNLTSAGDRDIFISKLDGDGSFVWAKRMGGIDNDSGRSIAVDSSSNVYTNGHFSGTADFDPGPGIYNLTSVGGRDIFISMLDGSGNFVWSKRMGGPVGDQVLSITVDVSSNVYTTGFYYGTSDFDPGPGTYNLTSAGDADIFISKLDKSGNFIWAKNMGGTIEDEGFSISVDSSGNVYTTGYFLATADFDPGPGIYNLTSKGGGDIFISKLDDSGSFTWAKSMGGTSGDGGNSIAVDPSGNVYVTGDFSGTVDFDPDLGTFNLTSAGFDDIFVSKLNSNGNFIWAKSMGGIGSDFGIGIAIDSTGNVYTIGFFAGTADFDPGISTFNLTCVGWDDIFVSKLNTSGNFLWAKSMGGSLSDEGIDIAINSSNNVYTTGYFNGTADFDPGLDTFNLTSAGESDIFLVKYEIKQTFVDVPATYPYFQDIEILYANGLTGGCQTSPLKFCPDQIMNRGQAAVFMLRGNFGSSYVPPVPTHIFQDDWSKGTWAEPWAEGMKLEGLSAGCLANPPKYCPWTQIPREQAVIFTLRMRYGKDYTPPPATGTVFADMTSPGYYATSWAEQAYKDGLIQNCGTSGGKPLFCPKNMVSRGLAAYMIVRAKNLTMP